MWTVFLHLSNFGYGLSSEADFSNTGANVLTSAECAPCIPVQKTMQFEYGLN